MTQKGPEFYDDDQIFEEYSQRRQRAGNPNDSIEKPIFQELTGSVTGLSILDLGCGNAAFGRDAFEQNCLRYVGVEGSKNMLHLAKESLAGTHGELNFSTIEDWIYPPETFDLVVSRLALHYIEDIPSLFLKVYQTLRSSGRFIFSVEHPVLTSCDRSMEASARRHDWIVDHYFETGERITPWMGGTVVKYHRTVEDYFIALQKAGFTIERLRESRPSKLMLEENEYQRRLRIPLFLLFAGQKK